MGKHFLWDPVEDNIVKELDDSGTPIADYSTEPYLYGDLISQHRDGQSSFYYYDGQGSTTSLTDSVGNVTDTYAYSAFGEVTVHTGTTVNPFQYSGRRGYYRDLETGEFDIRRRPYSKEGRWLSEDPIKSVSFRNAFEYCSNRPLVEVDPSGLWPGSFVVSFDQQPVCAGCKGFFLRWSYTIPEGDVTAPKRLLVFQRLAISQSWHLCSGSPMPCIGKNPCKVATSKTLCTAYNIEALDEILVQVVNKKAINAGTTDKWRVPQSGGKLSPCHSRGSVRFYAEVRGYAYDEKIDPRSPNAVDRWIPPGIRPNECGGSELGYTIDTAPEWWDRKPVLYKAVVEAYQSWNCCACLDDPARKSTFNVWSTSNGARKSEKSDDNCIDNPDLPNDPPL